LSGIYTTSCLPCPFPCATCTDVNTCSTCLSSFVLDNNMCKCDTLNDYYLDTIKDKCLRC
jgi:hypothetical protein